MFVQQKMTPTTMDPVQAKMMLYMMPTMMTAFMLFLPAGLCLYMLTNSTLEHRAAALHPVAAGSQAESPRPRGPG